MSELFLQIINNSRPVLELLHVNPTMKLIVSVFIQELLIQNIEEFPPASRNILKTPPVAFQATQVSIYISLLSSKHALMYFHVDYINQKKGRKQITEAHSPVPQETCSTYGPSLDVFVICKFKEIILACFLPLRDTVRQDAK